MAAAFPFLDESGPIAFAHRGASPDGLENTLAAFERVVRLGFRYVETDVRITRDGVPVLLHDPTLDRVTDSTGPVAALTAAELTGVRVRGVEPVPRLDDVLGAWPDLRLNLHLKTAEAAGPLAAAIRRTGAVDRVCVAAFPDRWIARVRAEVGPRLCTALGTAGVVRLRFGRRRAAPVPRAATAPCAQVPPRAGAVTVVDPRFLTAAHARGVQVHAWTINTAVEMTRLLDLGVDGIMTDRAELLRDVLTARGQWAA